MIPLQYPLQRQSSLNGRNSKANLVLEDCFCNGYCNGIIRGYLCTLRNQTVYNRYRPCFSHIVGIRLESQTQNSYLFTFEIANQLFTKLNSLQRLGFVYAFHSLQKLKAITESFRMSDEGFHVFRKTRATVA